MALSYPKEQSHLSMALLWKEKCLPIRFQSPEICTIHLSALLCPAEVKPGSAQVRKCWLQIEYQGPGDSISVCRGRVAEHGCVSRENWKVITENGSHNEGGRLNSRYAGKMQCNGKKEERGGKMKQEARKEGSRSEGKVITRLTKKKKK